MKKTASILLSWGLLIAPHEVSALQLDTPFEGVDASFDSVIDYSQMYRTAKAQRIVRDGQNIFANANDGSEYYKRGLISSEYKVTSELSLKRDNLGFFMRGSAWYDTQLMDHPPSGGNNALRNTDSDEKFPSGLRDSLGHGARVLDAFVYGSFEYNELPVTVRLGRQVINWGEGIYYGEGLNIVNPVDVGRIVLPSASLKEALLPSNMLSVQMGLSDSFSWEGFYGLEWRANQVIPTGGFFSDTDIFGKGTNGLIADLRGQLGGVGVPASLVPGVNGVDGVVAGARYAGEHDARGAGQFGFVLRYSAEELNNTEFGLYYINYHSKVPFISIHPGASYGCSGGGGGRFSDLCALTAASNPASVPLVDGLAMLDNTSYNLVYPEDIHLFGFTASGNVGDTNVALELTYRPNAPIEPSMTWEFQQLITGALLRGGASEAPVDLGKFGTVGSQPIDLYKRGEMFTSSMSAVHAFGPTLGLDDFFFLGEVASNYIPGHLTDTVNYAYLSPLSWGYTLSLTGTLKKVFTGVDLLPGLTFRQDVKGTSPAISENFIEGRKSSVLELGARYGSSLSGKLSYTAFWGARKNNPLIDRDNVALNVSYSF
ncbi:DUF1302 domain-containing protein [Pseudomonas poae]|nr:DUF1302 domain-containing protein [Pseudomonas poae]